MRWRRRVLPMLDPRYTRLRNTPPRLTDPAAATNGSVGDGAPQLASQIDAAKALHNRLHRDGMTHTPQYRECAKQPCGRNATREVLTNYGPLGWLCPEHYAELEVILAKPSRTAA